MNENTITSFSGDIRSHVWASYARKVETIRKFATKLGTRFEYTVSAPFGKIVGRDLNAGTDIIREFVHVELSAEIPVIDGWSFAAAIDHTTEGNLLRTSPRFAGSLPVSYRTDKATCDHCGCARARKSTFALVNAAGEWKRVGSSCLVDFLGHGDAVSLVEFAASIADLANSFGSSGDDDDGDEDCGGGSGETYYGVRSWIALAFRTIAATGAYVSGKAAREASLSGGYVESTAARALRHVHPGRNTYAEDRLPEITESEEAAHLASADAALAWILSDVATKPELTDFDHNLVVVAKTEAITRRHLGIAAYIPEAHRRHLGIVAERKARENGVASEWIGADGDKVESTFVLTGIRSSESEFGTTYWYAGLSGSNKVTIKGSNEYLTGLKRGETIEAEIGKTYKVKATVKWQETFRGEKSTTVTRARVVAA